MSAVATDPFIQELRGLVAKRNANPDHPFARRAFNCKPTLDGVQRVTLR